jgi:hypothetical protein
LIVYNWSHDPNIEDLDDLGLPFTEKEIKNVVDDPPADKALCPDGFTIAFFHSCWHIVKEDIIRVINAFSELSVQNMHVINTANIVLLPKKDAAESITDFRPISLIHMIPKIIVKAMALRCALR